MEIKAVAFDVDGTMYPNSMMYLLSLPLFLAHIPLIGAMNEVRKEIRLSPEVDDFHKVQARRLARRLSITPERAFALVEAKIYTKWYRIFKRMRPYKGLIECLSAFRDRGLKLAVMSDFPIRRRLKDLGIDILWDSQFSSEETGYLKPHPQPFLRLAAELALQPSEILYVGNSYEYDILGAVGAGMKAAHLCSRIRRDSVADFSFKKYGELRDFVLKSAVTGIK